MTGQHASHDVIPGWAALVIYAAGFAVTTRVAFSRSDDGDRLDAAIFGLLWPVVLAVLAVCALLTLPTLGAKTRQDQRAQAAIAERERHNLAAHIAELEAENDRLRRTS